MNYILSIKCKDLLKEKKLFLERAKLNDVDQIINLYAERVEWFKKMNIDQWTKYLIHHSKDEFLREIQNDYFFVLKRNGSIVAAFELSTDSRLWNDDDTKAYYIYKIVTKIGSKNIGSIIMTVCKDIAKTNHQRYLRLDCITKNKKLNSIYEHYGFKLIRIGSKDYYCYSLRELDLNEKGFKNINI